MAALPCCVLFYQHDPRSFRPAPECRARPAADQRPARIAGRGRTEQLSVLSRHLIRVSEEEKARLARELHDEMGANLTAIGMDLASVGEQLKAAIRTRPTCWPAPARPWSKRCS
jgi:signal transduction histidine kinase